MANSGIDRFQFSKNRVWIENRKPGVINRPKPKTDGTGF